MTSSSTPNEEANASRRILIGQSTCTTLPIGGDHITLATFPLPGLVIYVHGVNSEGEWYDGAEEGLCAGLNARLRRCDEHMKYHGAEAGQLSPARYLDELTSNGFINPLLQSKTFIKTDDTFSPVIRFRWGYKASAEELQKYGAGVYLNEHDYWGGGPFANGCSSLPDLWGEGLSDDLLLWIHVEHLNPENRPIFSCPPRPYFVLAALRLARLVESIRRRQADMPITIVCHSQGNMIAMAAAFIGDRMPDVKDPAGRSGRCVADSYVLANPPYSLTSPDFAQGWSERNQADAQGRTGRQTEQARTRTLAAFFDIVRRQAPGHQDVARIDVRMANKAHGFTARIDRDTYGLNGSTYGRVTLYCCPHDQVISAATIQGIGWLGLPGSRATGDDRQLPDQIGATAGRGVFTQRVFAQGFKVGEGSLRFYDYWRDHPADPKPRHGAGSFWFPESKKAAYSITRGVGAGENWFGKILTTVLAPFFIVALRSAGVPINADPPPGWKIPLDAPALPEPFVPQVLDGRVSSDRFDTGTDAPGRHRDASRQRDADDPYAGVTRGADGRTDEAAGNVRSEAALRYEHHAALRMKARREGLYESGRPVTEEDDPSTAGRPYAEWRGRKIKAMLADGIDTNATDHSTILGNAMHCEKALAYDVAIGCCDLWQKDLRRFRIAADWRLLKGLDDDDPHKEFDEYFLSGKFKAVHVSEWVRQPGSAGAIPEGIFDRRTFSAPDLSGGQNSNWPGA